MNQTETDTFETETGPLKITFVGHGTLIFQYNGLIVHVDPWSKLADYTNMPKADVVLVTHHHHDPGNGRRRRPFLQAPHPVPVPLW